MGPIAPLAVFVALGFAPVPSPSPSPSPSADPAAILDRAIKAAGGQERLSRARVLKWRGRTFVHTSDRRIELEGRWIVEPPDRAVIVTWEKGKEAAARRAIVRGTEGFTEHGAVRTPMPLGEVARERDRLYLYSLMRLLPLRDPGVRLISILAEASKAKFAKKYGLNFPLLADPDHEVAEKYVVWQEKSNYGKKYMGIARTTYLIGPDGKVQKRWDRVKVDAHADEVLAALA